MLNYDKEDVFWRDFADIPQNPYKSKTDLIGFRCLLVHLVKEGDLSGESYPIAIGYMASLLRMNGASVKIIIIDADSYNKKIFLGYDLICFYPMAALMLELMKMIERVKDGYPDSRICLFNSEQHQHEMILCGPRARDFARGLMGRYLCLDYILIGEAEMSLVKLSEKIAVKNGDFSEIPACFYRDQGQIKFSRKPIAPVNFNFLPYPSRDFLEKGISEDGRNNNSVRIQSSRGCVSPCFYCSESSVNITEGGRKTPWLGRPIKKFVDEIDLLSKRYGVIFFNCIDSSFEGPSGSKGVERMREFRDEIKRRNIQASFKIHLRVETIDKLDNESLRKLKEAGVDILAIGVESGVDTELKSYKKIANSDQSIKVVKRLDEMGIFFPLLGHMMFGPCLRLDDLSKKIEFLETVDRTWDYLDMSNNIIIYYGTAYHDCLREKGLVMNEDEVSGIVTYHYEDERVAGIAKSMSELKNKCPDVIRLHHLLYDALNVMARYSNRMNDHLWKIPDIFEEYKDVLRQILCKVGDVYKNYFIRLIGLAESGWSSRKEENLYQEWILNFFPDMAERTDKLINDLLARCENAGLSTMGLRLMTWLSLINTSIDTSMGGMNTKCCGIPR